MNVGGRPQAEINWDKVKSLLEAGCSGREIAGNIGISAHTLYDRCMTDNNIEFSKFSQQFHAKGESRLLAHQYAKALGLTTEGDNTLLIWLGKVRLKQKENSPIDDKLTLTATDIENKNMELKGLLDKYEQIFGKLDDNTREFANKSIQNLTKTEPELS